MMMPSSDCSFTVKEPGHWENNYVSLYWCHARAVKWARNWKILKVLDPPSEPQNYQRDCQSCKIGNGWPRQTLRKSHHPIATSNQRLRGKDWTLRVTCLIKTRTSFPQKLHCHCHRKGKAATGKICHRELLLVGAKTVLEKHCISTKRYDIFRNSNTISQGNAFTSNEAKPGWRKAPPLHYRDKSLRQTPYSTVFQPPTAQNPPLFWESIPAGRLPTPCDWQGLQYPEKSLRQADTSTAKAINTHGELHTMTRKTTAAKRLPSCSKRSLITVTKFGLFQEKDRDFCTWNGITFAELLLNLFLNLFCMNFNEL